MVKEEDSWEEARARAQAYGVYFLLPGWPVDRGSGRWQWQWEWWDPDNHRAEVPRDEYRIRVMVLVVVSLVVYVQEH